MSDKHRKAASAAGRYKKESMECNKPRRAPAGDKHKYVVKGCQDGKEALVRFGLRGLSDYLSHKDEKRRANFKARHNCDEKKDKLTPGYWACNHNW